MPADFGSCGEHTHDALTMKRAGRATTHVCMHCRLQLCMPQQNLDCRLGKPASRCVEVKESFDDTVPASLFRAGVCPS
ncbi:hypothetical protein MTO96_023704 [Rhipicephalus appendiculatus]